MARGGFPGMGGNMQQMIKQAQKMQQQIAQKQEELEAREHNATAGGGMVSISANGKREITSIKIDPQAVDPEDVEMLEDLIVAAVNEVMRTIEETNEGEMAKITGGAKLGF